MKADFCPVIPQQVDTAAHYHATQPSLPQDSTQTTVASGIPAPVFYPVLQPFYTVSPQLMDSLPAFTDTTSFRFQHYAPDAAFQHTNLLQIGVLTVARQQEQQAKSSDSTSYLFTHYHTDENYQQTALNNLLMAKTPSVAEEDGVAYHMQATDTLPQHQAAETDTTSFFYESLAKDDNFQQITLLNTLKSNANGHEAERGMFEAATFNSVVSDFTKYTETPRQELFDKHVLTGTDWMVGVFVLCLFVLAWLRIYYNKFLGRTLSAAIDFKESARMFRDNHLLSGQVDLALNFIFVINVGLFVFHFINFYNIRVFSANNFVNFLTFSGITLGIFLAKSVINKLIGFVSTNGDFVEEYSHNIFIYNKAIGIILLPITLGIPFMAELPASIFIKIGLGLFFIFFLMRLIRGIRVFWAKRISPFYMILYLCTFEILPVLIGYRLIEMNLYV